MVQRTTRRILNQSEGFLQITGPVRKHDDAIIRLALFQPDIAPNVGAILRLGACLGVPVHVIEPCGFPFSPHAWRRSAMDYADLAELNRHDSWATFLAERPPGRLVAMTTKGAISLWNFRFQPGDTLLMGRESAGLPDEVHAAADARLLIPMQPGARSLNVAMTAAIAVSEAGRQLSPALPKGYAIRRASAPDIPRLREIERDGAQVYSAVGYDFCLTGEVRAPEEHRRGLESGALFVVDGPEGSPVAFALAWIVDGRAHLTELSVTRGHQRLGLGRALIGAVESWANAGGFPELTLTTYRDVAWNAPLYARLGWEAIEVGPDRPGLAAVIEEEAAYGYAAAPRVAMAKRLRC
jgi:tRNA (cytidine/uridine-2'-O-)-methyltransferase